MEIISEHIVLPFLPARPFPPFKTSFCALMSSSTACPECYKIGEPPWLVYGRIDLWSPNVSLGFLHSPHIWFNVFSQLWTLLRGGSFPLHFVCECMHECVPVCVHAREYVCILHFLGVYSLDSQLTLGHLSPVSLSQGNRTVTSVRNTSGNLAWLVRLAVLCWKEIPLSHLAKCKEIRYCTLQLGFYPNRKWFASLQLLPRGGWDSAVGVQGEASLGWAQAVS